MNNEGSMLCKVLYFQYLGTDICTLEKIYRGTGTKKMKYLGTGIGILNVPNRYFYF